MVREISQEEYRRALGRFTTGVTVVTTRWEDVVHGMTANAFASVSVDPFLVLVCVDRAANMHELLPRTKAFAVTVLAADQQRLSSWFASPGRPAGEDQFAGVAWWPAPVTACPVLEGGLAWVDCRLVEAHEGGDHSIFVGEVADLGVRDHDEPLVFYRGGYHTLGPATG